MKKIRRSLVALAAATAVTVAGAPAASAATYPEPLNQVIDKMVAVSYTHLTLPTTPYV